MGHDAVYVRQNNPDHPNGKLASLSQIVMDQDKVMKAVNATIVLYTVVTRLVGTTMDHP